MWRDTAEHRDPQRALFLFNHTVWSLLLRLYYRDLPNITLFIY